MRTLIVAFAALIALSGCSTIKKSVTKSEVDLSTNRTTKTEAVKVTTETIKKTSTTPEVKQDTTAKLEDITIKPLVLENDHQRVVVSFDDVKDEITLDATVKPQKVEEEIQREIKEEQTTKEKEKSDYKSEDLTKEVEKTPDKRLFWAMFAAVCIALLLLIYRIGNIIK